MGSKKAPLTLAGIKAKLKPRETTVPIVLAGDLAAEHALLEAELARVSQSWEPNNLADPDPRRSLAARIAELQAQMRDSEVHVRLRALQGTAWSDLLAAHPGRGPKESFNPVTLQAPALAACAVDPLLSDADAAELLGMLAEADQNRLFEAIWTINTEALAVPFSLTASAVQYTTGGK